MMKFRVLCCCTILCLSSCEATKPLPALRVVLQESNGDDRELLERALAEMLNDSSVIIAEDAFIKNSEIIIERQSIADSDGNRIMGRSFESPLHFRLWKQGNVCFIEHVETEEKKEVPNLECVEIPES
jgi:hypothetical protein